MAGRGDDLPIFLGTIKTRKSKLKGCRYKALKLGFEYSVDICSISNIEM